MRKQSGFAGSSATEPRVTVIIPAPLRAFTGGLAEIELTADSVAEAIAAISSENEGFASRILMPDGDVRPLVNIFVDKDDIRTLDGLKTRLRDGAVVAIIPAVAGG